MPFVALGLNGSDDTSALASDQVNKVKILRARLDVMALESNVEEMIGDGATELKEPEPEGEDMDIGDTEYVVEGRTEKGRKEERGYRRKENKHTAIQQCPLKCVFVCVVALVNVRRSEVIIDTDTSFPFPFNIPAGQPFSDTFTPDEYKDDDTNGTLYIISDFWDRGHTVFCNYPCTLMFPPYTTTSTWTPTPFTTVVSETEFTTIFPPITTQKIKISKTTVQSTENSSPTKTISPVPGLDPICITITIPIIGITITIGLCPPKIEPFPPPIPAVTIIPPPPGTQPGPINPGNLPTPDQEDAEDDEDDEDQDPEVCLFDPDYLDRGDPTDFDGTGWAGGPYNPNLPDMADYVPMPDPPAAGTGNPATSSTTVPVNTPRNPNQQPTGTVTSATTPRVPPAPTPTTTTPVIRPRYDSGTESSHCYGGLHIDGAALREAFEWFCSRTHGKKISNDNFYAIERPWFIFTDIRVGVCGRNKCEFTVTNDECRRVFEKVVGCREGINLYRSGGYVDSNCAQWTLDPNSTPELSNDCTLIVETGVCLR
ncbi:hypothetical protein OQA88_7116 [Cercophora sp. LCS_1]